MGHGMPGMGGGGPNRDLEKRMNDMEKKLDRLMDEIKSQKKDTGARYKESQPDREAKLSEAF
jgi:hypothetical protein